MADVVNGIGGAHDEVAVDDVLNAGVRPWWPSLVALELGEDDIGGASKATGANELDRAVANGCHIA